MDTILKTCARLQNVPINRRHSRKLILNIVKKIFFLSIAFSKLGYLHVTDLVGSLPFMYLGTERAVFSVMLGIAEVFATLKLKGCLCCLQAWSLHQA